MPLAIASWKVIEAGVGAACELADAFPDAALFAAQTFELAGAVVDDADRGGEAEGKGAGGDGVVRPAGLRDAAADDGVDVDVEVGVLREPDEALVENLEGLFADVVGHDVVDGDLQVVEAGAC